MTTPSVYGCHNRRPYLLINKVPGGQAIPFRNSNDCQYTTSDLGQADPKCNGCKWRLGAPVAQSE